MTDRLSAASAALDKSHAEIKREILSNIHVSNLLARLVVKLAGMADPAKLTAQDYAQIQLAANIADQQGPINDPVRVNWPGTDKPILPSNVVSLRSPPGGNPAGY